jgi:hypothetical protein
VQVCSGQGSVSVATAITVAADHGKP